jgi:ABC-type transporter Mla subunit MlaD
MAIRPVHRQAIHNPKSIDRGTAVGALKGMLVELRTLTRQLSDRIDKAVTRNDEINGLVSDAGELATSTEQTQRAREALDEASGVSGVVTQKLGIVSASMAGLEDQIDAAIDSLRAAEQVADDLRQAGAGGKATAPARHDA